MATISSPQPSVQYNAASLTKLTFDRDFGARQVVAAILLCFEDRYATREEILDTLAQLPAVSTCLGNTSLDQVLGMPDRSDSGDIPTWVVKALKSVSKLLGNDKKKYYSDFPLSQASPPSSDPEEVADWEAEMAQETTEQEQDPQEVNMPFKHDYLNGDWYDEYEEEEYERGQRRGPPYRNYFLKPGKENDIFAKYIGWEAADSRTFTCHPDLPLELRIMVLKETFTFDETLKVVYTAEYKDSGPDAPDAPSPKEELTEMIFTYDFRAQVRLALVPETDMQHLLHLGDTAAILRRPYPLGNRELCADVTAILYGKNTFQIEDSDGQRKWGTHRFLEFMLQLGYLRHIRKLNINICIGAYDQHIWHLRRTSWALVCMENLTRLVVNVDMTTIINDTETDYFDPDYHFIGYGAAYDFKQWPLLRMLYWSPEEFAVYVPQHRAPEKWFKRKQGRGEADEFKFWAKQDWEEDSSGLFLNGDVSVEGKTKNIVSRHSEHQELVLDRDDYDSDREDPDVAW